MPLSLRHVASPMAYKTFSVRYMSILPLRVICLSVRLSSGRELGISSMLTTGPPLAKELLLSSSGGAKNPGAASVGCEESQPGRQIWSCLLRVPFLTACLKQCRKGVRFVLLTFASEMPVLLGRFMHSGRPRSRRKNKTIRGRSQPSARRCAGETSVN
jgi:hypothetical protein